MSKAKFSELFGEYFEKLDTGIPTLDISDCPDLGPVLIALAALNLVWKNTDILLSISYLCFGLM